MDRKAYNDKRAIPVRINRYHYIEGRSGQMIQIGVVNIDTSHPKAFTEYLKRKNRAGYTAVYNDSFRGDDEVEAFCKMNHFAKRCASIEELADRVDIGFIQSCNCFGRTNRTNRFFKGIE